MKRLILPLILLVAASGLFVVYTDPRYQESKKLAAQAASYDEALNKSQELRKTRDELLARRNTFAEEDIQKLHQILPDNVDNIRLIIDINSIAARHGLSLKNVQLGDLSSTAGAQNPLAVGASGSPVGSVALGFTLGATYDDFLSFMQDLEHSLRILDIEKISFSADASGNNDYTFSVRTYWLH